jgi:hypothetical protein
MQKLRMCIENKPLGVCPLCNKTIKDDFLAVKRKNKLIFYAHENCVVILDKFICKVKEVL